MDIVSRIKKFIEFSSITNSQFADTCLIPRPTVSQLLNGRNKKVSDEIISKIHTAFPNLSISWLLFNEGDMLMPDNLSSKHNGSDDSIFMDGALNLFGNENLSELSDVVENANTLDKNVTHDVVINDVDSNLIEENEKVSIKSSLGSKGRKVVNIIVFYSDNSFEYFRPIQK